MSKICYYWIKKYKKKDKSKKRKLKKINKIISEFSKTKKIFKNKKEDSIYDLPKEQSESDYFE
jgi:hypothetical protein